MSKPPSEYYVYYEDVKLYERELRRAGGHHDDTEPANYWTDAEPDDYGLPRTLEGARELAKRLQANGTASKHNAIIHRRKGIYHDGFIWDWEDEETVEDG